MFAFLPAPGVCGARRRATDAVASSDWSSWRDGHQDAQGGSQCGPAPGDTTIGVLEGRSERDRGAEGRGVGAWKLQHMEFKLIFR